MSLIVEEHKAHLKEQLAKSLDGPVRLVLFTQENECQFCSETRELMLEVVSLAPDKISVEVYDFAKDTEKVKEFGEIKPL